MSDRGYKTTLRGTPNVLREYRCEEHGCFELDVPRETSQNPRPCPTCGAPSERTLTANIATHVNVGLFRGKSDGPRSPLDLDTRPLAEGMPLKEWRAKRSRLHRDRRRAEAKARGLR